MPRLTAALIFACLVLCNGLRQAAAQADGASRPEWIWATAPRHDPQQVTLRNQVRIDGAIQRADLRLATEFTRCELHIGDRAVFVLDDYGPWLDLDLTEYVVSGDNVVELHCHGSPGPSAVAFELTVSTVDGRRTVLRSDAGWQTRRVGKDTLTWHPVQTFGQVAAEAWNADRTTRITAFDDYEQWRLASGDGGVAEAAEFLLPPGFEIQRVRSASASEGSWVSMEFDPQGRLMIAREDTGLLRMTLAADGTSVTRVETVETTLQECRGLLFAGGSLYAQANNSKALYRLDDQDSDGIFERTEQLREFPGGVGHGRNDLAPGPDGAIYAIFGDSVDLPVDNITDLTSPFREARRGIRTTEGHVLRYFPASSQWQLFCSGLRNPFGIAFNRDGEAFTYDADAEFDMGAPWYRPTRLVQLVSGGDYGWRGRTGAWPPYDADHPDFTLPSADIGKGSPTAVKSGDRSAFPAPYRKAMFLLDWAYGRVLACHLLPRGAGYVCRAETFLRGRPLNVTDLDFGPDGCMYLITGGRKTHSDLYRVSWKGDAGELSNGTEQQAARSAYSASQRELRRRLAAGHGPAGGPDVLVGAWKHIGDPDPLVRDAARVVIESQPVASWSRLALEETRPAAAVSGLLSLARSERDEFIPEILQRLLEIPTASLSGYDRLMLLETWSRCLARPAAAEAQAFADTVSRIQRWYPDQSVPFIPPTGSGHSINHQLALLAERLGIPDLVRKTLQLLRQARTQEERLHAIFVLRNSRSGWTEESRRVVFEALGELDRTVTGGEGMPGFLQQIRDELAATLTDSERQALADLVLPGTKHEPVVLTIDRPVVRQWQTTDVPELLAGGQTPPDPARGRRLFDVALCRRCHRAESTGGVVGPDLTSLASRFSRSDILLSIVDPSRVVDDKYRTEQVVTTDGRVIVGRIVTGGDYRSPTLRISTDALRPGEVVEISRSDIERHQPSPLSPMPSGLLDTLTADEIRDLLAWLTDQASDHH